MTSADPKLFRVKTDSQKLRTIVDADGREVIVKGREDEEQSKKLEEISDLLVAAGYFRAQIKGVSPFDKVVGGICWCIDSCNVDIDAELLFQEDLSIGQKISLTEKIVVVLPEMKCPHRIEPHQIQGLDFIHIFPVIQWLVKRAMESREERQEYLCSLAVNKFHTQFKMKNDSTGPRYKGVAAIIEKYKTQSNSQDKSKPSEKLLQRVEDSLLDTEIETKEDKDSTMQADDIIFAFEKYSTDSDMNMKIEKEKLQRELQQVRANKAKLIELINENKAQIQSYRELQQVNVDIPSDQVEIADKLKDLYVTYESLKEKEKKFKEECKMQLAELQRSTEDSSDNDQDESDMKQQVAELSEKVSKMKLKLAQKSRSVAVLERKIDQVPGRDELAQYQRRFLELYTQIAAKHKETKQFYTLYNTFNDSYSYLSKELSLLNSILDSYPEAMNSQASKEQFIQQFENIVDGVRQNKYKVEQRRNSEKFQRDQLSNQLTSLLEQQRQYVMAQKQLSAECHNYETLLKQAQNSTS
ncbi:coiled-coil domain-containing protein 93 isoform X3 [Diaphorina citri]|uniref:Coiled-coil domain-containing protein 93 n=1 Tax=Diaphorina citri TaxID=121845 RepID=A0A1S4EDF7_DIACI|nr:coiled-coil domain-containing protein 93 isoform X2 [Diaphorina citri]XP_026680582.1 coiled-coil domain-containing protein 93 isoform X3 [Diaphorina citri]